MITYGSRFFYALSGILLVAAAVYGVATGNLKGDDYLGVVDPAAVVGVLSLGWKGGIGDHAGYTILLFGSMSAFFLGVVMSAFRDADPAAVAALAGTENAPPSARPARRTYWPAMTGFGIGVTIIGLVTHGSLFIVGLLILLIVLIEWMVTAWADRATGDPEVNAELRKQIMGPFEVPLVGALAVAALALSASRVFLAVSEAWAVWVAVIAASVIFLGAALLSIRPDLGKPVLTAVLVLGAVGVLAAGIISAAVGARDIEHHGEEGVEHSEDEGALATLVGP